MKRFQFHDVATLQKQKQFVSVETPYLREVFRMTFLLPIILFMSCNASFCEIRNGYEDNILILRQSLKNLTAILTEDENLSGIQRRNVESKVDVLVNHISYYDLTENLLSQFRIVAPKLYAEMDTITDRKGRPVHVYVKFVPVDATKVKAWGTTYINQVKNDEDAYLSEYGAFTVSIKIWIVPNGLQVLSHELGHVKYQIPNLASYVTFHKKYYKGEMSNFVGHHPHDPSGKTAVQTEKLFRKQYVQFLKNSDEKLQNPVILLTKIRKGISPKHYAVVRPRKPTVAM